MPLGSFINSFPPALFLLVHLVAFLAGAFFAYRAFNADARLLGWGFALYYLRPARRVQLDLHLPRPGYEGHHHGGGALSLVYKGAAAANDASRRSDHRQRLHKYDARDTQHNSAVVLKQFLEQQYLG